MSNKYRLRDYQRECLKTIKGRYQAGVRRQLICLPTGSGKTVIFAKFPRYFRMQKQMLVLAHRKELLDQAYDKIKAINPELNVAVEQADRSADPDCDVVIASVPTLGRRGSNRIQRLDPDRFFLVVVDEAHHATAATYRRVLDYFGVLAPESPKLLVGFTATPKRGDGQGLDAVFQEIVFSRSLPEMIPKWLAPVAGYRVETDVDLSRVKTRLGDFVTSHLSQAVNTTLRNDLVVDVFRSNLKDRKTLCFCVDVAHTDSVANAFKEAGIPAAAVTGEMDPAKREKALEDFHTGRIQVLANCMVLTEGYDEPSITGIILARPTKSALLYTQMIGRGTRKYRGKENVTIIDIVDVTRDHSLTTLPSLFGFAEQFDLEGHTTDEVQRDIRWVETHRPWIPIDKATSLSDLRYRCQRINLLDLETPAELQPFSDFAWIDRGRGGYRLGLADATAILVAPTILGDWEVILRGRQEETIITRANRLEGAIQQAEDHVSQHLPESVGLVRRHAHWRQTPASEKQVRLLRDQKIVVPEGLTKGQASHLISMLFRNR